MSAVLTALPVGLLVLGTPIFVVFLAAVAFAVFFVLPTPPIALHQVLFGGLDNYALLAIPFFIFAGELMGTSGIAARHRAGRPVLRQLLVAQRDRLIRRRLRLDQLDQLVDGGRGDRHGRD